MLQQAGAAVAHHAAAAPLLLHHPHHLAARQGQAAGHDEPQIPAAQHQGPAAGLPMVQVEHPLHQTGGVHPGGPGTGDRQRTDGLFPAAGGQDEPPEGYRLIPGGAGQLRRPPLGQGEHRGVQPYTDRRPLHLGNDAPGVLRAGQVPVEVAQAKAVVDALGQDAPQLGLPVGQ